MNTTTKVIFGITVATAVGAVLGLSLSTDQRAFLFLKIKGGAKLVKSYASLIPTQKTNLHIGEITSELIEID